MWNHPHEFTQNHMPVAKWETIQLHASWIFLIVRFLEWSYLVNIPSLSERVDSQNRMEESASDLFSSIVLLMAWYRWVRRHMQLR